MSNIWFTSDLHLNHQQEFLWGPRGFSNEQEMNEAIVERWNSVVKSDDIVYDLGDIALNDVTGTIDYLNKLNGTHYWLLGNHDTENKIEQLCHSCHKLIIPNEKYAMIIKAGKMSIYMSHYPTLTANFDDKHFSRHVLSLHGHTHQQKNWLYPDNPFLYHVGLDSHNCTPVHIDEIVADVRNRWNDLGMNTDILKRDDMYGIPRS